MNTEQLKTRLTKEELKNSLENQMFAAFLQGKNGGKFHEWYEANYHDVCLLTVTNFASQESKRAVEEFKEKLKVDIKYMRNRTFKQDGMPVGENEDFVRACDDILDLIKKM